MQIVIDIPEETKATIDTLNDKFDAIKEAFYGSMAIMAIQNGTPLPKGHGRLIDADKLKLTQHDIHVEAINYRHRCISIENIDEAPTIIEADKVESEEV